VYQDKRAIQELQVEEGIFFLDAQRKFLEIKLKTRTYQHFTAHKEIMLLLLRQKLPLSRPSRGPLHPHPI
jgi:hypothetical protein